MNNKKILQFLGSLLAFILLFTTGGKAQTLFPSGGGTSPKPGTHEPIITHAYAIDKGYYGYIWKIYIEADDPDGDMLKIASVVDQVGYGYYPTDWIYLKPQYQKHFKGYIQWNTFGQASHMSEWTQITLKVSIIDRAGNESNVVVFLFEFVSGGAPKLKLPAPFDQGDLPRLGYIDINLRNPNEEVGNRSIFLRLR